MGDISFYLKHISSSTLFPTELTIGLNIREYDFITDTVSDT